MPALDGLRGLAIIAVMLHNFSVTGGAVETDLAAVFEWGWVGVQLFFVLSGYLVTRILLETRHVRGALSAFMVRRALRIAPLYFAVLFVYFIVLPRVLAVPNVRAALPHQIWYWLYLSNWFDPLGLGAPGLNHFWSIAVEAQFYLVWPVLVMVLGERRLTRLCFAIVAISFASCVAIRLGVAGSAMAVYKSTLTRMSAPVIGGLVAIIQRRPAWRDALARNVETVALCVVGSLAIVVLARHGFSHRDVVVQTVGFTILAFFFATWLFIIVCELPVLGGLPITVPASSTLCTIGRVSYGMYIFHYPLHWAVMKPLRGWLFASSGGSADVRLGAYIVVAMAATYGIAWLSWTYFERPMLGLKRYFQTGRPVA